MSAPVTLTAETVESKTRFTFVYGEKLFPPPTISREINSFPELAAWLVGYRYTQTGEKSRWRDVSLGVHQSLHA